MSDYPTVSPDLSHPISENLQKLAVLFPAVVKDGELDIEALREELGQFQEIQPGDEKYELNWVGKQAAKKKAFEPLLGKTLKLLGDSKHPDTTQNLFIEGDNLEALKLLRQNYFGEVKMIYIDPPYNTGKDFVYRDNFKISPDQSELEEGTISELGERLVKNEKSSNRFHARWLDMMYPRLRLAKDLLREDGVIFISIDDNEVANLKLLCDEVFGWENFVAQFIHKNNSSKNQAKLVSISTEYFYCYAKNKVSIKDVEWRLKKKGASDVVSQFQKLKSKNIPLDEILNEIKEMYKRPKYSHLSRWNKVDENGVFKDADLSREGGPKNYTIVNPETGLECKIPSRGWGKSLDELLRLQNEGLIYYGEENVASLKDYIGTDDVSVPDNFWYHDNSVDTRWCKKEFGALVFENPKPLEMIRNIVEVASGLDSLILDFFAGSSTTAHAVMQLNAEDGGNRRFIMVQIPEPTPEDSEARKAGYPTIAEISKERIRRAGEKIKADNPSAVPTLDVGFKSFRIEETKINWLKKDLRGEEFNLTDVSDKDALDFVAGFTDVDIVYELILRQANIPLTERVTTLSQVGARTYLYGESYVVCLEEQISPALVEALAALEPTPLKFFFRDSAFGKDIALKDETFRRLNAEIAKHSDVKAAYTVEFI